MLGLTLFFFNSLQKINVCQLISLQNVLMSGLFEDREKNKSHKSTDLCIAKVTHSRTMMGEVKMTANGANS